MHTHILNLPQLRGFPPSASFSLHLCYVSYALSWFFLSLPLAFLCTPPPLLLTSWWGPVHWPCPVHYFLSLLWTVPEASDCSAPTYTIKTIPWVVMSSVYTTYPFAKHLWCSTGTQKAKPQVWHLWKLHPWNEGHQKGLEAASEFLVLSFPSKAAGEARTPLPTASLKNQTHTGQWGISLVNSFCL